MSTTNSSGYSAVNRAPGRPVRLSILAISPSVEDLSVLNGIFNDDTFPQGPWKLHLAGTCREALAQLRPDATIDSHRSDRIIPGWQSRMSFDGETADLLRIG